MKELELENYPGLFMWAQSNHMGPDQTEALGSGSVVGHLIKEERSKKREDAVMLLAWTTEDVTLSQGMWEPLKPGEVKEIDSPLRASRPKKAF